MELPKLLAFFAAAAFLPTTIAWGQDQSDHDALLRLHENSIRGHLEGDVDLMLEGTPDSFINVDRGGVRHETKAESAAFLKPFFETTTFDVYRDTIPPIVKISNDGSIAWVIAQIEAVGRQRTHDGTERAIEYSAAWISLYENRDGTWWFIGIAANFNAPS